MELWLFIIFLIFYEPLVGFFMYKRFKRNLKLNKEAKVRYYRFIMIGLWVPTLYIILLILFTELRFVDLGIGTVVVNTAQFDSWISYSVLGLGTLYFIYCLFIAIGYHYIPKIRKQIKEQKQKMNDSDISILLPVTNKEKKIWTYVSITTGITEEIIYRGFTIYALTELFPNLSTFLIIGISSILFGLAHTYQGISGVIRTSIVGFIFGLLYLVLGSIIPIIILHFLINFIAKLDEDHIQSQHT